VGLPEETTVTRDRARKKAIRRRMAASGEPYNVAARSLPEPAPLIDLPELAPANDAATVRAIIACAATTLAEPSARMEFRTDWEFAARPGRRPSGLAGRLVRRAARAAWARVAPDTDIASLRETFAHQVAVGYLEPARDRYLMNSGAYAEMRVDGTHFGGLPGAPLQRRPQSRAGAGGPEEPLELLRLLQAATGARFTGEAVLHGTACRLAAVTADSAQLAVWADDQHIRRIQRAYSVPGEQGSTTKSLTLDLWDFGVPVDGLDWSRLPSFAGLLE
jgi:hypothetical protein